MNLLLCDDHRLFSEALAEVLRSYGHRIVAITTRPDDAAGICEASPVDVCLMDLHFRTGPSGLEGIRTVRDRSRARVVVVTAIHDADMYADAIDAGAVGIIGKEAAVETILDLLVRVHGGEVVVPQDALSRLMAHRNGRDRARYPGTTLTPREHQVLELLAAGGATATIAKELHITVATVRTHVQNILAKLGAHSKLEAVAIALSEGIVAPARSA